MNSPFAEGYIAILNRLRTGLTKEEMSHLDQELGQLEAYQPGGHPPVTFPCGLIDFDNFSFEQEGENIQRATGDVIIRIGYKPLSSSGAATPTIYREKAITFWEIEWKLHKLLQDWSPGEMFGHLIRKRAVTERREDNIRVRELRYGFNFEDYSTKHALNTAAVNVEVLIEE
jgi:hypothetical protein